MPDQSRMSRLRRPRDVHPYDLLCGVRRRALRACLRRRFAAYGAGSTYDPTTSVVSGYRNIRLGADVFIGPHAFLSADGVTIDIGDGTVAGPGLYVIAGDHEFDAPGVSFRASARGSNLPIRIGRNVWFGARVTVLKGVTIGDGAIIAAGTLVNHDVEACAIVAGVPARFLRWRFEGADRARHAAFLRDGPGGRAAAAR